MRAGYPFPFLTTESVGPQLARHGSDWQRRELVPRILAGECLVAIGYSEPGAGTDLASLTTSARPDGDGWVISGQKMTQPTPSGRALVVSRSEEHTSELQSRGHLVCRLLLEKKKNNTHT